MLHSDYIWVSIFAVKSFLNRLSLPQAPPMAASLDREGNGFTDSISDRKAPVKSEEKVERFVMEVVLEEHEEEKKKEKKKKRRETIGEKRELPKLDLEKPNQDSSSGVRSTKASIPKVENTCKPALKSFFMSNLVVLNLNFQEILIGYLFFSAQSGLTPLPIAVTGWPGGLPPLGWVTLSCVCSSISDIFFP